MAARRLFLSSSYKRSEVIVRTLSAVPANTQNKETIEVKGASVDDLLYMEPPALTAGLLWGGARISAKDTVEVTIFNLTGASITPGSTELKYCRL